MKKISELNIKPLPKSLSNSWNGAYCPKTKTLFLGKIRGFKKIIKILNHETMHSVLHRLEGESTAWLWDNYENYDIIDNL